MSETVQILASMLVGAAIGYVLIWIDHVRKMRKIDRDITERQRQRAAEWQQRVQEIEMAHREDT